jgi:hypothetical protein
VLARQTLRYCIVIVQDVGGSVPLLAAWKVVLDL